MTTTNVQKLPVDAPVMVQHSPMNAYTDSNLFNQMQRAGTMLAASQLVPKHLQNKVADCTLVAIMALDMKINPIMLAQNIYFVHGSPGWNAAFLISRANQSGKLKEPIQFDVAGEGDSLAVTAWARLAGVEGDGKIKKTVTMKMAVADGWATNPKYKSIPEQMLSYRAATFLIRLYMPEIMFGIQAADELEDVGPVSYTEVQRRPAEADYQDVEELEVIEADTAEEEPAEEEVEETTLVDSFGEVLFSGPKDEATSKLVELIGNSSPGELQSISEYNEWADAKLFEAAKKAS